MMAVTLDMDRIRTLGKKVVGAAAAGAFVGGVIHAGAASVADHPGDAFVKAIAAEQGDVQHTPAVSLDPDAVETDISTSSGSDTIDFHRLSC